MKYRELHRLLQEYKFFIVRYNKHIIYSNGTTNVAVPHTKIIATGTLRDIFKILHPNDPGMANKQMRIQLGKVA